MSTPELSSTLLATIDRWIEALDRYPFPSLLQKPSHESWSLGQLYMHLLEDTQFYLEQMRAACASNDHVQDEATPQGKSLMAANAFPDMRIKGAPGDPPQPASIDQLKKELEQLKQDVTEVARQMEASTFEGKALHPGFGYLTAGQWLQFADMHWRHHGRQQERIERSNAGLL